MLIQLEIDRINELQRFDFEEAQKHNVIYAPTRSQKIKAKRRRKQMSR